MKNFWNILVWIGETDEDEFVVEGETIIEAFEEAEKRLDNDNSKIVEIRLVEERED